MQVHVMMYMACSSLKLHMCHQHYAVSNPGTNQAYTCLTSVIETNYLLYCQFLVTFCHICLCSVSYKTDLKVEHYCFWIAHFWRPENLISLFHYISASLYCINLSPFTKDFRGGGTKMSYFNLSRPFLWNGLHI